VIGYFPMGANGFPIILPKQPNGLIAFGLHVIGNPPISA